MPAQTDSNLMERLKRAVYPSDPNNPDGDWNLRTLGGSGGTSTTDDTAFTPGSSSVTPAAGYYGGRSVGSGHVAAMAISGSGVLQVDVISTVGGAGGGSAVSNADDTSFLVGTGNIVPAGAYYGGRSVGSGHVVLPAVSGSAILKSDANLYRQISVATLGIASGNTAASFVDARTAAIFGLITPPLLTGTYFLFDVSADGAVFQRLFDSTGVQVSLSIQGSGGYDLPTSLISWPYWRPVSSTAEASPRTITVVSKG